MITMSKQDWKLFKYGDTFVYNNVEYVISQKVTYADDTHYLRGYDKDNINIYISLLVVLS